MNDQSSNAPLKLRLFPEVRLSKKYPWPVWIIGWMVIIKSFFWIFTEPAVEAPVLRILGYKYLIYMIPFLVCGIGLWNLRKWAVWGVVLLAVTELLFFLVYPESLTSIIIDTSALISLIMSVIVVIINGPVSDIIILLFSPVLIKNAGKYELLAEE